MNQRFAHVRCVHTLSVHLTKNPLTRRLAPFTCNRPVKWAVYWGTDVRLIPNVGPFYMCSWHANATERFAHVVNAACEKQLLVEYVELMHDAALRADMEFMKVRAEESAKRLSGVAP